MNSLSKKFDPLAYVTSSEALGGEMSPEERRMLTAAAEGLPRDELVNLMRAQFIAMAQLQRRAGQSQQQAIRDMLTNLPNRKALENMLIERAETAARYGTTNIVAFIDLDGFKAVNDVLGHSQGDAVLKDVARHLDASFRKTDFVARYGGDEMVILLQYDANETFDPDIMREKIRDALDGLVYWHGETPLPIGASIGFASVNEFGAEAVKFADADMYEDKAGKDARLSVLRAKAISGRNPGLDAHVA